MVLSRESKLKDGGWSLSANDVINSKFKMAPWDLLKACILEDALSVKMDDASIAVLILRTHHPSGRTWANILKFVWLCVSGIKTGTRRFMCRCMFRFSPGPRKGSWSNSNKQRGMKEILLFPFCCRSQGRSPLNMLNYSINLCFKLLDHENGLRNIPLRRFNINLRSQTW